MTECIGRDAGHCTQRPYSFRIYLLSFNVTNPAEVATQIATRVKACRLELSLTQEGLASRAGMKFATYRRFEQTGEISLRGQILN